MTTRIRPAAGAARARAARLVGLAALAAMLLAPTSGPRIEWIRGAVEIGRGEPPAWRAAQAGEELAPGDAVRTGRDGRAELALPAGSVRLYGDSLLRLPLAGAPGQAEAVLLDAGSSLFDVLRRGGDTFEVRTPEVVVSIKGTRFLVVADERPEVAVYHGVVGLRREQGSARELLVREGFAALAEPGRAFDLVWSGAPDPWEAWLDVPMPPRAPSGPAAEAGDVDAAKAAARAASRSEAVEQAVRRHPELGERMAEAIADRAPTRGEVSPAAPSPDPLADVNDAGKALLEERYVETWLNDVSGTGQDFDLQPLTDAVVVNLAGQSWTLSTTDLEAALDGVTTLPQPLLDAVAGQPDGSEQLAGRLLGLLR
jgi:hypothetical protein